MLRTVNMERNLKSCWVYRVAPLVLSCPELVGRNGPTLAEGPIQLMMPVNDNHHLSS